MIYKKLIIMILFVNIDLQFNWKSVIQGIFKRVNIEIDPYTEIFTTHMLYIQGLGPLLKKTPIRTIGAFF